MEDHELAAWLKEHAGFSSATRVRIFKGYRERQDGAMREVTVEVWEDLGTDVPNARFYVRARDHDGRMAIGNGADNLQVALSGVHWWDLDR